METPARATDPRRTSAESSGLIDIATLRRITTASAAGTSRIVIELDDRVTYQASRIANPERIYFDLYRARISSELPSRNILVKDGLVRGIRLAQNQSGVVRVVFDIAGVKDYTASLLHDPPRLVVDLHGAEQTLARQAKKPNPGPLKSRGPALSTSAQNTANADTNSGPRNPEGMTAESRTTAAPLSAERAAEKTERSVDSSLEAPLATAPIHNPAPTKSSRRVSPSDPLGPAPVPPPARDGQRSHNALQGNPTGLTEEQREIFRRYNAMNAEDFDDDYDFVIVHDPQPVAMIDHFADSEAKWIWRGHIDFSTPNQEVIDFLLPSIRRYDAAIFHMPQYVPRAEGLPECFIWPPAIDPLAPKNMAPGTRRCCAA